MIPLRKWLLRGLYTVVVLLLLVVVAVLFLLATSPGRSLTVGLVNNLVSSDDQKVELVGLESVMGALQLSALRLSDKQGVWLEAKGLSADYSLSDLLMLRFSANHITLEQLAIKRAPQATDAPAPTESGPLLPDIPAIRAQIDDIAIKSIQIDETLLGIPASLSLSGKLTLEDQPLRLSGALDILHTDGGNGYVKASWDFIPVQNRRKINISLFGPRGGLAARLMAMKDLPAIQVTLVGDGSADDWQSQLSVSLDEKPMIGGQLTARLANGTRRIEAQLDGTLAPFVPQSLLPLVAGKSQLTLSAEQIGDTKLTLPQFSFTSELASLKAVGTVDLTENTLDVSTRFQLGQEGTHIALEQPQGAPLYLGLVDLAARIHGPMSQAALQLQGSVAHIGSGQTLIEKTTVSATSNTFDVGNGTGPIKALFAIEQVATGSDPLDRMVRGPITLSIDSTLGGSSVDLTKAKLDAGLLSAVFQGVLSAKELALDGTFTLRDLDVIEPDLAGALSGELAIKGTAQAPALTLSVEGDALSVANKAIEGLQLKISADATPNAALALTARYAGAPLEIKADLTSDTDGNKQIENIVINAPDTQVKGAVSLSPTGLASGVLDAEISDFKQLGALLLQPDLEGALKAKITLSDENDRQVIALEAVAPQIITKDLSLAGLALNARIVDPSKSMAVDAKLDMGDLRAGGEQLRQFSARMVGQDGSLPFSVTALFSNSPLQIQGTLTQLANQTSLTLNQFDASWKGVALALVGPSEIDLSDGVALAKPLALSIDGGSVQVSGKAGDTLDLSVALRGLPLAIANKVAATGEDISGQLTLDARITGQADNPSVDWTGTVSSLSAKSMRQAGVPAMGIATKGQLQNNIINVQTAITGGGTKLDVNGAVSLNNQTLDLAADGTLPFSLIARTLADAGLRLDGNASLSAKISGPLSKPDITGSLATKGTRFIELSSGLVLRDLSGTVRLAGQTAQLDNFQGRIGTDGTLSMNGTVGIDPAEQIPADIKLSISKGTFKHEDILSTLFDANLTLEGKLAGQSTISGQINLTTTEISIPETLPGSVSSVDVQHVNAQGKVAEQIKSLAPKQSSQQAKSSDGSAIALNMSISSPRRIYLRGRGIDAELGGTIRILGTTDSPNPVGSMSLTRGRMDLLTKRLEFDSGSVNFAGSLDPSLDFSASSTSSGTTYTLALGGYASAPEINLSSSPEMPEDEILANLFFDRDLADLSPLQLVQLANAIATISGVNSGPGVLDRLRNLAGIDNVDVKSDEETGETTVGVGRYLNDKTYLNVEKGTASDSGKVTIDLEISKSFKARGEADTSGNSKAGIFFEKDY